MVGTGERLRMLWRDRGASWAVAAHTTERTFLYVGVFGSLPGVAVELTFFGDTRNKRNIYHCPGGLRGCSVTLRECCSMKQ